MASIDQFKGYLNGKSGKNWSVYPFDEIEMRKTYKQFAHKKYYIEDNAGKVSFINSTPYTNGDVSGYFTSKETVMFKDGYLFNYIRRSKKSFSGDVYELQDYYNVMTKDKNGQLEMKRYWLTNDDVKIEDGYTTKTYNLATHYENEAEEMEKNRVVTALKLFEQSVEEKNRADYFGLKF